MLEFDMKDLGEARKILGMEIIRDRSLRQLKLTQNSYIKKVLNNYIMSNCKVVKTPIASHFKLSSNDFPKTVEDKEYMGKIPYANTVGSLLYLMVCTRLDRGYVVSMVSRYISNPGKNHREAVKWILRFLNGTQDVGLVFKVVDGCRGKIVTGYMDADFAKDKDNGRSFTGYVFMVLGNVVSWKSQLQHVVTLSTTEAEFVALTEGVKESIWLKGFVHNFGIELLDT
ncbi:putative RNA-directed DNA polymerase [Helianthus anomalus]